MFTSSFTINQLRYELAAALRDGRARDAARYQAELDLRGWVEPVSVDRPW